MKVGVVMENPRNDEHIAIPVIEKVFEDLGRKATVRAIKEPHISGISQLLDPAKLDSILEKNPMEDLVIIVVDRDGDERNEKRAHAQAERRKDKLCAVVAFQELEAWMLALYADELGERWKQVRDDPDCKETFAEPLLDAKRWSGGPGRGRKMAMRALAGKWQSLKSRCAEVQDLINRLQARLASTVT